MKLWATLLWASASIVLLAAGSMVAFGSAPVSFYWLDNFHWTFTYVAAAALAWIGVAAAGRDDFTPRCWFAVGLSLNAVGHGIWMLQQSLKWQSFPSPADWLFLGLGLACAIGFGTILRKRMDRSQRWPAALDASAFSVAVVAFVLALYLPRRGELGPWAMAVVAGYPVTLLGAASVGVILVLTLHLRPGGGAGLFLLALIGSGLTWMQWNLQELEQTNRYGSWLHLAFSATTLALGYGAMRWRAETSSDPLWERFCKAGLRLLPIFMVIAAAGAITLVLILPGRSEGMLISIEVGAAVVFGLALARQTVMLADRNRMLAAEHRLREAEGNFRTLFEMADDAIFILDGSVFVECNQSTLRLFGCTREEILGISPRILCPKTQPDGQDSVEKALGIVKAAMAGTPQAFEWKWRRKSDGKEFDAEVHVNRIDRDGRAQLGAIVRDVTERKTAEEQVRLSTERLQLAIRAGKVGIWDLDLGSGKMVWDEQMYILYGMTRSEEEGPARWFDGLHPEDRPTVEAIHAEALSEAGKSFETNFRIIRQNDGSLRFMRAIGTVLRDAAGRPLRYLGVNWDVTDERLREERLTESIRHEKELADQARAGEQAKSEFLAVMSHEIRTPMNGILGFAELLAKTPTLSKDCRDSVETIVTSSENLLRILDDILVFSRLEAGGVKIEKVAFSPREMLGQIGTLMAPGAERKRLDFRVAVDPAIPEQLIGDVGRMRQVLFNLVGNAIKFSQKGWVEVGVRRPAENGGHIEFFVQDTGMGIAAEKLEEIFQPFVQADSSISRRHGGTGLGLTISRRLTELMGGRLHVESRSGEGAIFRVIVPMEPVDPQAPLHGITEVEEALDATFAAFHPLKILFVEDDSVNLKLLAIVLRKLGYEPSTAHNGREAVRKFQEVRPDFILMDIQMPDLDGIEATRQIRRIEQVSNARRTFIAAHTANISPTDKQRCFDAGMDYYLNKPLRPSLLAQALKLAEASSGENGY